MTGRVDPIQVARWFRVPYRVVIGCINKPLIHKGRKP